MAEKMSIRDRISMFEQTFDSIPRNPRVPPKVAPKPKKRLDEFGRPISINSDVKRLNNSLSLKNDNVSENDTEKEGNGSQVGFDETNKDNLLTGNSYTGDTQEIHSENKEKIKGDEEQLESSAFNADGNTLRDSGTVSDLNDSNADTEGNQTSDLIEAESLECQSELNFNEPCECPRQRTSSNSSDSSDSSSSQESDVKEEEVAIAETKKPKKKVDPLRIIEEFTATEMTYRLDLEAIKKSQDIMVEANSKHQLNLSDKINEIFINFNTIYRMHKDQFWPQMDKYIESEEKEWLGSLFVTNNFILNAYKPFLLDQARNRIIIDELLQVPEVKAPMEEFCQEEKRMQFGLGSIYNVCFTRITRYTILLNEYIKHLSEDSPDLANAKVACEKVSNESKLANEYKKKNENFVQMTAILNRIGNGTSIDIQPWEKFIKEGPVWKISARRNERVQPRYLFLFTGRLLVCYVKLGHMLRHHLDVSSMEVQDIEDPDKHPFSFRIKTKRRLLDLKFENQEIADEWYKEISNVIKQKNEQVITRERVGGKTDINLLGKQAPEWIKDEHCSMCYICYTKFTFVNRKHHCRACGNVVCGSCSDFKHPLEFENNESKRVCRDCKEYFTSGTLKNQATQKSKNQDGVLLAETLGFSDSSKQLRDCYVQLHQEGSIHIKNKLKDVKAERVIPIVGFSLAKWEDIENCFRLCHPRYEYFFTTSNSERLEVWMEKVQEVLTSFTG